MSGPSAEVYPMQNFMLNSNLFSKMPGHTSEERKSRKDDRKPSNSRYPPRTKTTIDSNQVCPDRRLRSIRCRISCSTQICSQKCPDILLKRENREKMTENPQIRGIHQEQRPPSTLTKYVRT